ncbi:MAG: glycosyltransferase family 2 protein [Bacteroidota bacterium]
MNNPFFSVVIPTRNRVGSLLRCLGSLESQTLPPGQFEVLIADDGSTDGTARELDLRSYPFPLRVIPSGGRGPGAARNAAAREAAGRFLAFTEDDVVPDACWLERARMHLEGNPPCILEGKTLLEGTGAPVRRFERHPRPSFIPCNLFVPRDVFRTLGGYAEEFYDGGGGLYFREDADFGFRALDGGIPWSWAADVQVSHPVQFGTLGAALRHARRYYFDPLLYRRHPLRYRSLIEVKNVMGLELRRPMHYLAGPVLLAALWCAVSLLAGDRSGAAASGVVLFAGGVLVRCRYEGGKAFRPLALAGSPAYLAVSAVYVWSLLRGCVRFRSFGLLL